MKKLRLIIIVQALIFLNQGCEKEKKSTGLPTDGDGNTYDTVVLGSQVWLTENLKTTKYNKGTPIPLAEENESWTNSSRGTYCWYQNNSSYKDSYGVIYNWYAAQLSEDICPVGYHVPSREEWENLIDYFNNSSSDLEESFRAINAGWRAWDGSFRSTSYGSWWIYSLDGSRVTNTWWNITTMPKNTGFSIRCVKNK